MFPMRGRISRAEALSLELRTDDDLIVDPVNQHDALVGPTLAHGLLLGCLSGDNFSP